jgi:glucose dehydrogenase
VGKITSKRKSRSKNKVEKVMREFKNGSLYSSSGHKVTKRNQAIAIALSKAGLTRKIKKVVRRKKRK